MSSAGDELLAGMKQQDFQQLLRRELEVMGQQLREGAREDMQQALRVQRALDQAEHAAAASAPTPTSLRRTAVTSEEKTCDNPVAVTRPLVVTVSAPTATAATASAVGVESPVPSPAFRTSVSRPSLCPSAASSGAAPTAAPEPHVWTQRHRRSFMGSAHVRKLLEMDRSGSNISFSTGFANGWEWFRRRMGWAGHEPCMEWARRGDSFDSEMVREPGGPVSPTLLGSRSRYGDEKSLRSGSGLQEGPSRLSKQSSLCSSKRSKLSRVNVEQDSVKSSIASGSRSGKKITKVERVMGLYPTGRTSDNLHHTGREHRVRRWARRIVQSWAFELVVQLVILSNAVQVGLQTDSMASAHSLRVPVGHRFANHVFATWFTLEVSLRLFVHRWRFFTMWGCGWNIFDMVLVFLQLAEEVLLVAENISADTDDIDEDILGLPNNALLRTARILRVVKVMRVMRMMRYFEDLRLLVSCILHSVKPFFWALALIFIIIYVVGTNLTHIVLVHRIGEDPTTENSQALEVYYGSVFKSLMSMFQGLTGGVDWRDLLDPLLEHEQLHCAAIGFLAYLAFAILGVMNVVTGTFVQNAIERSEEVKEINKVTQARKLFKSLDVDHSGCISFEEIHSHLHSPPVQEFLSSIDVDVSEVRCLFEVMDMSGSGTIDFDEFLSACLRLQGPARALDLILLTRDTRRFFEQQTAQLQCLQGAHPLQAAAAVELQQPPPPPPPPPPEDGSAAAASLRCSGRDEDGDTVVLSLHAAPHDGNEHDMHADAAHTSALEHVSESESC